MKSSITRLGSLIAVAMAVPATAVRADTSLADLVNGATITSGNLIFSDFTAHESSYSVGLDNIDVYTTTYHGSAGIVLQCGLWTLGGASKNYDLSLSYTVTTVDNSATLGSLVSLMVGSDNASGHSVVSENALDSNSDTLGQFDVSLNYPGTGVTKLQNSITFANQSELFINQDFSLTTDDDSSAEVSVSHFDQIFPVPEPSALAMISGLVCLALILRGRHA
jgi:hypothetical protein